MERKVNFPSFVRILTKLKTKYVEINGKNETKIIFDRIPLKIIELLSQALKFSYELIPAGKIEIGRRLNNGSWTGMIGFVQRNKTDMVIGTISVSEPRLEAADFSYPYYRNRITFATTKPEPVTDFMAFLLPFSLETWIFTISALLHVPASWFVLFDRKCSLKKLVFAAYKIVVLQDMGLKPRSAIEYILLTFWQIGAGFLIFCYTGVLLSFITFHILSGVRTIPELAVAVSKGKYHCTSFPGSFLNRILLNSNDINDRIIGQNLLQNNGTRDILAVLGKKKSKKKPVFIGGEMELLPYKLKYFISKDEFVPALRSIALRRDFCCRRQLNKVLGYVWASGIFEKLKEEYTYLETLRLIQRSSDILGTDAKNPLSSEDLAGAFILLALGYVLATTAFILELIIWKQRSNNKDH